MKFKFWVKLGNETIWEVVEIDDDDIDTIDTFKFTAEMDHRFEVWLHSQIETGWGRTMEDEKG